MELTGEVKKIGLRHDFDSAAYFITGRFSPEKLRPKKIVIYLIESQSWAQFIHGRIKFREKESDEFVAKFSMLIGHFFFVVLDS